MGVWTSACLCCKGVLFGVYVQTLIHVVMELDHQVEFFGISIGLCMGIHPPPAPSSRVFCRFQLIFLLGCLLDGDMGTAVQCDAALFTFCFGEVVTHGMAGHVIEESFHREL